MNEQNYSMEISAELTLSPLEDGYEAHIIRFIKKMRDSGFAVMENPLSTQIYGPYDAVMSLLQQEIKTVFEEMDQGLIFLKIVKTNRSDYQPHF